MKSEQISEFDFICFIRCVFSQLSYMFVGNQWEKTIKAKFEIYLDSSSILPGASGELKISQSHFGVLSVFHIYRW